MRNLYDDGYDLAALDASALPAGLQLRRPALVNNAAYQPARFIPFVSHSVGEEQLAQAVASFMRSLGGHPCAVAIYPHQSLPVVWDNRIWAVIVQVRNLRYAPPTDFAFVHRIGLRVQAILGCTPYATYK